MTSDLLSALLFLECRNEEFDAMLRNSDFILQTLEGSRMEWEESMWFWNSASMAGRKEGLETRGKAQKGGKLSRAAAGAAPRPKVPGSHQRSGSYRHAGVPPSDGQRR